jgi:hypothetical protein
LLAAGAAGRAVFRRQAQELLQCAASTGAGGISPDDRFPHIRITEKAFPPATEIAIAAVRSQLRQYEPGPEMDLLKLAAMAALEDVS